ncbi:Ribonuclease III family protein [Forsythia ovata]|uniref:Ribonuclease III family protein n=1 Tax=Forsythia ovata TaxID=205694 RepID=A0ABD1PF98_9LAMI
MATIFPMLTYAPLVRASSVDTHQRISYNPHRTYPKKPEESLSSTPSTASSTNRNHTNISDLLKRDARITRQVELGDTHLGYERWLPSPPKVEKPRSMFNAASLAYIGDSIYELYARRHFLLPPLNIEEYNDRVMAVVRCEAQDAMLQKLINDNYLSQEERDVLRWGRNIGSAKTRTKKRAGVAVYNRASSLETLVGYLYLTNVQRLEEIMVKIGFSTDYSTQLMQEKSTIVGVHWYSGVGDREVYNAAVRTMQSLLPEK